MNSRQKKIINQLMDEETWIKGKELGATSGVTSRTIRSDIETINSKYPNLITSSTREGYKINQELPEESQSFKKELGPQTPRERALYIIKLLLLEKKPLKMIDLVDHLFVSEHTIESDIKRIREMITSYEDLRLVRSSNCLYFSGDEQSKRKLHRRLLDKEIQDDFLNLNQIAELYEDFDLLEVMRIFEDILELYQYTIRPETIPMITVHIGITIERILKHHYLDKKANADQLAKSIEYEITTDFFQQIKKIIPIDVPEEEIIGLTAIMVGYKDASSLQDTVIYFGKEKNISKLLDDILKQINNVFELDFSEDEDFINGLHLHVQSLVSRIENNTQIPNVHHEEIKQSYSLIFEIGVHVAQVISDYFAVKISESEISFITLHIGAAYSRLQEKEQSKYRAMLLAPQNESFLKIVKSKIRSMFEDRMEIVKVSQYLVEESVKEKNIDLIITTIPFKHNLNVKTVKISMFFDYDDESKIFRALNMLDKEKFMDEFSDEFGTLIDERFYFTQLDLDTPKEVIHYMSNKLEEENIVTEGFKESVLEREEMAATSFAYSVAVPHPLTLMSKQSKIVIGILKKPIRWNNYEVQLVIMPVIEEKDSHKMWLFFDWLSETIMNTKKMTKLIGSKTKKEFVHWMLFEEEK